MRLFGTLIVIYMLALGADAAKTRAFVPSWHFAPHSKPIVTATALP